ncbi:MAG: arsenite methyltransferase, partial [Thermomicrobiales bacterium]|nr:arsenite methyltransferase [Thermomicrobiales bacterium]
TGRSGETTDTAFADPITANLYAAADAAVIPADAFRASLGCGNPTALAELRLGETVLDLGSGGGIDVLLSARRVGPTGFAYGLDMTDEMLALAEKNRAEAGAENVRFLKGRIEAIPLPDDSVDILISNCVINLAADKRSVLHEAFRVLRPGGRFAVSDVVAPGMLPADLRADMEAWVGCVAGALEENEYRHLLVEAGFAGVEIEVTRVYDPKELAESLGSGNGCCGASGAWDASAYARFAGSGGRLVSAFVRARKP